MEGAFGPRKGSTAGGYKTFESELKLTGLLISDPSLIENWNNSLHEMEAITGVHITWISY